MKRKGVRRRRRLIEIKPFGVPHSEALFVDHPL